MSKGKGNNTNNTRIERLLHSVPLHVNFLSSLGYGSEDSYCPATILVLVMYMNTGTVLFFRVE